MNINTSSRPSGPRRALPIPPRPSVSPTASPISENRSNPPTSNNPLIQPKPVAERLSTAPPAMGSQYTASPDKWASYNSRMSVDEVVLGTPISKNRNNPPTQDNPSHPISHRRRHTTSSALDAQGYRPEPSDSPQGQHSSGPRTVRSNSTPFFQTASPVSENHPSSPTQGSPITRQARVFKRHSTTERQLSFEVKDVHQELGSNICPLAATLINLTKTKGGQDFLNQIKITETTNGFSVKFPGQKRATEVKQEELSKSHLITENTTLKVLELAYDGIKNRSVKKISNEIGISQEELGNGMETPHEVLSRIFGNDKVTQLAGKQSQQSGGLSLSFINRGEHWLSAEKKADGSFKTINPMYTDELQNMAYHRTYKPSELNQTANGPELVTLQLKA